MQIKVGDLVYRKRNQYLNSRHSNEIWLVTGRVRDNGVWIQIQNVHNGNRLRSREVTLMKI